MKLDSGLPPNKSPNHRPRRRLQVRRTLQLNILVAFAALLIMTVLFISGYTYRQNSRSVLLLSDALIAQVTDTVIERTANHLTPASIMAQISADIPAIEDQSLVDNPELEAYGMAILNQYPQLAGFYIGGESGEFLFTKRFADSSIGTQVIDRSSATPLRTWTYRDPAGNVTDVEITSDFTYDPRERPWYIGARERGGQYWTDVYIFFTDQQPGITAAYPIYDDSGNLLSVVGIDVALVELSAFLETQRVGETGQVFIVDDAGNVIAFPNRDLAQADGDAFRPTQVADLNLAWISAAYSQFQRDGDRSFTVESDGTRYLASFTPFPPDFEQDWQIGIVVPEDDFIGTIKQTNSVSLVISVAILMLAIVLALFIARSISRPIVHLTRAARKIQNFELDSNLQIDSPIYEVQQLVEAMNAMKNGLEAFKKYVPADLVRQLIQTGEEAHLGGNLRELTIFFTDIAGFTALSEDMIPEELMQQLSIYLGDLASIIMAENGTVDKYMGDGLLAFWGAPLPTPGHAFYACRAALRCRDKAKELNDQWQASGKITFPTRIGVHTGDTLVGNMGSASRMNYTVLGDSVNLASRLEAVNELYGTEVIVSDATYRQVSDKFHFRPLDIVTVMGKRRDVLLYELVGEQGHTPAEQIAFCEAFNRGFTAYLNRDWEQAGQIFTELTSANPEDQAAHIYLTRCLTLQANPPGPEWHPVTHLESKVIRSRQLVPGSDEDEMIV